jgi:hypothetical protein
MLSFQQNKQITVVHGEPLLLNPAYPEKYRKRVQKQWEARGIKFALGDFVDSFPESGTGEIVFRSGKKMTTDLVVSSLFFTSICAQFQIARYSLLVRSLTLMLLLLPSEKIC